MRTSGPLPGEPVEEAPGEPPVCPGCGVVAEYTEVGIAEPNQPLVVAWHWVSIHDEGCPWLSNPDSESY